MRSIGLIIPAAGKGTRLGLAKPKVFIKIGQKTILEHTLEKFLSFFEVTQITIPVSRDMIAEALNTIGHLDNRISVVVGGAERVHSIQNAIAFLNDDIEYVAVHDAARPFVTEEDIRKVFDAAYKFDAAVLCAPVVNTIKQSDEHGNLVKTVDRNKLKNALTPQVFSRELMLEAYAKVNEINNLATDDAWLVEQMGHPIKLIEGSSDNIKITHKADLELAKSKLIEAKNMETTFRVGQGYDVHRLKEGRKLIIGGIEIPFEKGLDGHSDADILLHAITDALIGALALGDIGSHFPDNDQKFKNIDSSILLNRVYKIVQEKGYQLVNIDSTIIAERPKFRGRIDEMRLKISSTLGINIEAVSVKATTSERMGFVGREEGMTAMATVLLKKV